MVPQPGPQSNVDSYLPATPFSQGYPLDVNEAMARVIQDFGVELLLNPDVACQSVRLRRLSNQHSH